MQLSFTPWSLAEDSVVTWDSAGICGVCVCVFVLNREGSCVFASRALVVVWTAVYLTAYSDCLTACSDCLTGFREPLSPPYRCQIVLKEV